MFGSICRKHYRKSRPPTHQAGDDPASGGSGAWLVAEGCRPRQRGGADRGLMVAQNSMNFGSQQVAEVGSLQ